LHFRIPETPGDESWKDSETRSRYQGYSEFSISEVNQRNNEYTISKVKQRYNEFSISKVKER